MNLRLVSASVAVLSILVASIIVGGMAVVVGGLLYRWLAEIAPPAFALVCLIAGALLLAALVVLLGQLVLQHAVWPAEKRPAGSQTPDQMIAAELVRLANGNPTKLIAAALGVGFAFGFSPRLRETVYRTLVD